MWHNQALYWRGMMKTKGKKSKGRPSIFGLVKCHLEHNNTKRRKCCAGKGKRGRGSATSKRSRCRPHRNDDDDGTTATSTMTTTSRAVQYNGTYDIKGRRKIVLAVGILPLPPPDPAICFPALCNTGSAALYLFQFPAAILQGNDLPTASMPCLISLFGEIAPSVSALEETDRNFMEFKGKIGFRLKFCA